jgi:hypothetical protein
MAGWSVAGAGISTLATGLTPAVRRPLLSGSEAAAKRAAATPITIAPTNEEASGFDPARFRALRENMVSVLTLMRFMPGRV